MLIYENCKSAGMRLSAKKVDTYLESKFAQNQLHLSYHRLQVAYLELSPEETFGPKRKLSSTVLENLNTVLKCQM
jgi:hypothetical protein